MFGNSRSPNRVCQEKLSEISRDFSLNQQTVSRGLNKTWPFSLEVKELGQRFGVGIPPEETRP
jgi:hypothetical protein